MKNLLTLVILTVFYTNVYAQYDTLIISEKRYGMFQQHEKKFQMQRIELVLKNDAEAYAQFKKAKTVYDIAYAMSCVGCVFLGYEIGQEIGGGKIFNPAVIGITVGLIGISIP